MHKPLIWIGLTVLALALAQTVQRQLSLTINGKANEAKALVVGGQSYVPVSVLKEFGINATVSGTTLSLSGQTAGGANERASLEGCLGEWLFNGIWRARANKVEQTELNGAKVWAVTIEVRNATSKSLETWNAGWKDQRSLTLAFADGSTQVLDSGALGRDYNDKIYNAVIPQGAAVVSQINFLASRTDTPTKLLIEIDPARIRKDYTLSFATPNPSFRFKLDCSK